MNPNDVIITELTPYYDEDGFVGKIVESHGKIKSAPRITWWRWREVTIEPTIKALFDYVSVARKKNVCLIRGTHANPKRKRTRRQIAHRDKRGDHGFVDQPSRVLWMDGDGIELPAGDDWITDPAGVVAGLVARMGEPWCSASYVWFFSSTHGLEFDKYKIWTGALTHGDIRVRLGFITTRAITEDEALAMTMMAKVRFPEFDPAISRLVQPNYITRAQWEGHPGEDVLGTIPTIGWAQGEEEFLAIPDDLTTQARWLKAQGHGGVVAKHPSAEAAVRKIGTPVGGDADDDETRITGATGTIRPHLGAAANHLLRANPIPKGVTKESHAATITQEIERLIEQHRSEIDANLKRHHRRWSEVTGYLERNIPELIIWMISRSYHPGKIIELIKTTPEGQQAQPDPNTFDVDLAGMRERVADTVKRFATSRIDETPVPVALLSSQTGGGKSTNVRDAAVNLLQNRPPDHDNQTVVIALPTHKLGVEQIRMFEREHQDSNIKQATIRGRFAVDPDNPGELMCLRPDEARALEKHMISIDDHLCSKGRGEKKINCPRFHKCGYQRQKIAADGLDLAYVAHESLQHRKPAVVGYPQMIFIDESPLDAFLFGTDKPYELPLDALTEEPTANLSQYERAKLMRAREDLHDILDVLPTSDDPHVMTPVPMKALATFSSTEAAELRRLEWMEQGEVDIRPDTPRAHNEKELERIGWKNNAVAARATLWQIIENINRIDDHGNTRLDAEFCGHIQVARDEHNRVIRMCGIRPIADSWESSRPDKQEDHDELDASSRFDSFGLASDHDACAHCGKRDDRDVLLLEDTYNPDRPIATLHILCATAYFDKQLPKGQKNKKKPSRRAHKKIPILITDATGDAEILKHIWPQITSEEHTILHNPNVKTFQIADKAFSKTMIAPEDKTKAQKNKRNTTIDAARRMYAALLRRGLEYNGEPVAAIVYLSTEEWIRDNCFIPHWLTLTHHGAVAGLDEFKDVRALFVIGRPLPPAEAVVRQAEALSGRHIRDREFLEDKGRIPIVAGLPGPFAGHDAIEVTRWRHPDRLVDRLRWQVCEASIIQAAGRARALLRTAETPLDLHLWTDVPVPELGPMIPQLWADMKVGLDWVMMATGGVWIENDRQAEKAYPGVIGREALKQDRSRHPQTIPDLETLIGNPSEKVGRKYVYQLAGEGFQPTRAFFLAGEHPPPPDPEPDPVSGTLRIENPYTLCTQESPGDTSDTTSAAYVQAWLEQRLGALRRLEAGWPPSTSTLFALDLVTDAREIGTPECWSGTVEALVRRNAEAAAAVEAEASAPPKLPWTTPVLEELMLSQPEIDALNAEADAQEAKDAKGCAGVGVTLF
jgi:hypothetical protein